MVSVTTTGFGEQAIDALGAILDERRGGDVFAPALVVCARPLVAVGVRRALGRRPGGVAGIDVVTVDELIRRLAERDLAALGQHLPSPIEVQAAVRAELENDPGAFGSLAAHRTTEERLVELHRQLAGLDRATIDRMASDAAGLAADAIRVVDGLAPHAPAVRLDDGAVVLAVDRLATLPTGALGPIVVHLPEPVRPVDARLLAALARRDDCEVVVGLTGHRPVDRRHLARLAACSIQATLPPGAGDGEGLAQVVEVADPDDEVRAAIADISAHAALGIPLPAMAVLYTDADPYATLLAEHLAAADLPHAGPGHQVLAATVAGRFLTRIVGLAADGLDRAGVIGLLLSAPTLDGGRAIDGPAWDRLSRQAGVIDAEGWQLRLAELAPHLDEHDRAEASRLAAFVAGLDERLAPGRTVQSWASRAEWAQGLIDDYLAPSADWPDNEARARDLIDGMLSRIASLDGSGGGGGARPRPLDAFAGLLASELARRRVPGRPIGEGLVVAPIDAVAGLPFERVVVVGLAEGLYPRVPREDSLLPARVRAQSNGLLPPAEVITDLDVRALAAALAGSRRTGVMTTARGDLRTIRARSWPRGLDGLVAGRTSIPSHHRLLADHGRPASVADFGLRALIGHVDRGEPVHSHVLASADPVLSASLERARDRGRGRLNRHVGRVPAPSLVATDRLLSATALETYAACPRSYLFGRVFRLAEDDRPERIDEIRPNDRGTLMHAVLERFVAESLADGTVPAPGEPWSPERRARLSEILAEEVAAAQARGITGGRVSTLILHARLEVEIELFLDTDDRLRAERRSTPVTVEYGFGLDGEPSRLDLADGRTLQLRGRVDRVDATEDGGLLVIDYKGSSARAFAGLDDDPLDGGRRLQLPLYARVVADELGRDGPRTALYWLTRYGELRPMELEDEVETALDRAVGAALDGISAGLFPGIPGEAVGWPRLTFANCRYCDFDRICPTDRQREWEAIGTEPELAPIRPLVSGVAEEPVEPASTAGGSEPAS